MPLIVTLTPNPALDVSSSSERLEHTDKVRCTEPRFEPGGGGINVARVARRLGEGAVALFPSGGPFGEAIQALLEREGVPLDALAIAGWTRESIVVNEGATGLQYRLVFPGPQLTAPELDRLLGLVRLTVRPASFFVISGSTPPAMGRRFFNEVRDICKGTGAKLFLDTSGEGLRAAAGEGVYLIKPNRKELEIAVGSELQSEQDELEAARTLISWNWAKVIVASLGARGALLVTADEVQKIPPIPIQVCSAVGAGDSMLAGILFGLSRGLQLQESVRIGVAAGTAALITPGSELARREDVERLYGTPFSKLGVAGSSGAEGS
jgi:6-phosphofructokinase 2